MPPGGQQESVTAPPSRGSGTRSLESITPAGDLLAGLLALAASAIGILILVPRWVHVPASVAGTLNSPAMMPRYFFVALGALGAILAYQAFIRLKLPSNGARIPMADWLRAGVLIVLCLLYMVAIDLIGLPIASALALFTTMLVFGERRIIVLSVIVVIVPALLWAFFTKVAGVPMPDPVFEIACVQGVDFVGRKLPS